MSAGPTPAGTSEPTVDRSLDRLAPLFAEAVRAAISDLTAAGSDAYVYEARRSHELAVLYYARGRTIIPPHGKVTNAPDETRSWHGYGLAVDVISRSKGWDQPPSWFAYVAQTFKRHGCKWGGDWKQKDLPHMQWGRCKASPSDEARRLLAADGPVGVWRACKAIL
jgi:peptidoglycan L-alanyl-D-glutamate endopeptidase CwlK